MPTLFHQGPRDSRGFRLLAVLPEEISQFLHIQALYEIGGAGLLVPIHPHVEGAAFAKGESPPRIR